MPTIDEKRVYAEKTGTTEVYVASEVGIVLVTVSGEIAGEFSIAHRCTALDVASEDGAVAVATDEDVLSLQDGEFDSTDFGPAVAVGFSDGDLVAASQDGTVARQVDDTWEPLGTVDDARAIDGQMLAAADGVYQLDDDLQHVGLTDATDIAAAGVPLAATSEGLYKLGNGWMDLLDGGFRVVSSDGERGHAATADTLYAADLPDDWHEISLPVDAQIAGLADTPGLHVAITTDGTFLIETTDGWRTRSLGVRGIGGIAIR